MSTTSLTIRLADTASGRSVFRSFTRLWAAFQERRKRARLHAALSDLSAAELQDIGITRGEIDYVDSEIPIRSRPPTGRSDKV